MAKKARATGGRQLQLWDEELAKAAEEQMASRAPIGAGMQIGTRGGVLSVGGDPIKGNRLKAIILGRLYENAFYEGDFDPDNPRAPVCFAFSDPTWKGTDVAKMMVPHEASIKKQSDTCATCPQNKFGTADRGRGKACKNIVRLGLLPEDSLKSADEVASAQMATLKSPVTSVRGYHEYEALVAKTCKAPTWGVVTEIGVEQDTKVQYRLTFSLSSELKKTNGAMLGPVRERIAAAFGDLAVPYQPSEDEPPARSKKKEKKTVAAKGKTAKFRR